MPILRRVVDSCSNIAYYSRFRRKRFDIGMEPVARTDYSWYSIACTFMIFIAILTTLKDLPVHGNGFMSSIPACMPKWWLTIIWSGFEIMSLIAACIPKWFITICEALLIIYIAWGLWILCREKGLKNKWIFPCRIGLLAIGCMFALWNPNGIDLFVALLVAINGNNNNNHSDNNRRHCNKKGFTIVRYYADCHYGY